MSQSTSVKPKKPKYQQLSQSLLDRIHGGEFPVGSRLPSIEAASREWNASYVTTQRAYRLLVEEGILESSPGVAGTRVIATEPRVSPARHLVLGGVFRPLRQRNEAENFALDMFEGVCRSAAARRVAMLHHRMGRDSEGPLGAVDKALADFASGAVQGLVLDQITPDAELPKVEAAGCPSVMFCRHPSSVRIESVAPDKEWAGRETAARALAAGYERIAICGGSPGYPDDPPMRVTRRAFFTDYIQSIEQSAFPRGRVTARYEPPPQDAQIYASEDALFDWYGVPRKPSGPRTLFVLHNDVLAIRLLACLRARGFRIPQEAGVIGMLDADCNRHAETPVTTWRIDPFEMGSTAVEILLDRLAFPDRAPVRRYLKPEFVDHGTL